jgi:hypothetical protein
LVFIPASELYPVEPVQTEEVSMVPEYAVSPDHFPGVLLRWRSVDSLSNDPVE